MLHIMFYTYKEMQSTRYDEDLGISFDTVLCKITSLEQDVVFVVWPSVSSHCEILHIIQHFHRFLIREAEKETPLPLFAFPRINFSTFGLHSLWWNTWNHLAIYAFVWGIEPWRIIPVAWWIKTGSYIITHMTLLFRIHVVPLGYFKVVGLYVIVCWVLCLLSLHMCPLSLLCSKRSKASAVQRVRSKRRHRHIPKHRHPGRSRF